MNLGSVSREAVDKQFLKFDILSHEPQTKPTKSIAEHFQNKSTFCFFSSGEGVSNLLQATDLFFLFSSRFS